MHRGAMISQEHLQQNIMACLGDASRFRLVQALGEGSRCVTDLAVEVGLSQSCTTRHLQALERRRVVCRARAGKRVLYRLCQEPSLAPLLAWALGPEDAGAGPSGEVPRPKPSGAEGRVPRARSVRDGATLPTGEPEVGSEPVRSPSRRPEIEDFLL